MARQVAQPSLDYSRWLGLWVAAQVVTASVVLVAVATTTPLDPGIAWPGAGLRPDLATTAGLTFWMAFGLVGGVRSRLQPGGGVVTFSMPFIVAGGVLGGPLAAGLMGLVSELEVRELRMRPWYGVLANHAVGILAAISSALVAGAARGALHTALPNDAALVLFLTVGIGALVFSTVNVALVVPTFAFRNKLTLREASRAPDATFRASTVAEAILAWNLVVAYQLVAWWAPIAIVALVLAVWQAFDRGEELKHDALTGLLNDLGFAPPFEAAVRAAAAGKRSAAFLSLDLDGLWEVNLNFGTAGGDVLLKTCAKRMNAAVRATDAVCRKASTGDEFMVLLDEIADVAAAVRVAQRIQAAVSEPIHLRGSDRHELMQAGISIGVVMIERGTTMTTLQIAELGERRLKLSKILNGRIVTAGNGPTPAQLAKYEHDKDVKRNGAHGRPHA